MRKFLKIQFNRFVNLVQWLPYFPFGARRKRLINKRSAYNTVALLKKLGITPDHLIDVGCNESQWTHWLWQFYHKDMRIDSFDPQPRQDFFLEDRVGARERPRFFLG